LADKACGGKGAPAGGAGMGVAEKAVVGACGSHISVNGFLRSPDSVAARDGITQVQAQAD